jgi:hypothetical protein
MGEHEAMYVWMDLWQEVEHVLAHGGTAAALAEFDLRPGVEVKCI